MPAPTLEQLQDAVADLLSDERKTTRREIDLIKERNTETRQRVEKLDGIVRSLEVSNKAELVERDLAALTGQVKALAETPYAMNADLTAAFEKINTELMGRTGAITTDVQKLRESEDVKNVEQALLEKIEALTVDMKAVRDDKAEFTEGLTVSLDLINEVEKKTQERFAEMAEAIPELPDIEALEAKWFDHFETMQDRQKKAEEKIELAMDINGRIEKSGNEQLERVDEVLHELRDDLTEEQKATEHQFSATIEDIKNLQGQIDAQRVNQEKESAAIMMTVNQRLERETEKVTKELAAKLEVARLDADLWRETTKNEIGRVDMRLEESSELFDALTEQIKGLADKKKELENLHKTILGQRMEHLGGYKLGREYRKNQMVCRDGATFICVAEKTDVDPREKTDEPNWRLMAAKGEPGAPAERIKGKPGGPGKPGKDGVSFLGAEIKGGALVLVSSDGNAHRVDLSETINGMVDARLASKGNDK